MEAAVLVGLGFVSAFASGLLGAPLGAALSHRLDAKVLRWALAVLIAVAALRMVVSAV